MSVCVLFTSRLYNLILICRLVKITIISSCRTIFCLGIAWIVEKIWWQTGHRYSDHRNGFCRHCGRCCHGRSSANLWIHDVQFLNASHRSRKCYFVVSSTFSSSLWWFDLLRWSIRRQKHFTCQPERLMCRLCSVDRTALRPVWPLNIRNALPPGMLIVRDWKYCRRTTVKTLKVSGVRFGMGVFSPIFFGAEFYLAENIFCRNSFSRMPNWPNNLFAKY